MAAVEVINGERYLFTTQGGAIARLIITRNEANLRSDLSKLLELDEWTIEDEWMLQESFWKLIIGLVTGILISASYNSVDSRFIVLF